MTDPIVPRGGDRGPATSASLLGHALEGDSEAQNRLYFLYAPLVEKWCRMRGLRDYEVEDQTQEVFATLFQKLDQFRKERPGDSFRRWLKALTNNKVTDFLRKASKEPAAGGGTDARDLLEGLPQGGADSGTEPGGIDPELKEMLIRCLDIVRSEFAPKTVDAFLARTVEGRPSSEVADALVTTRNAVDLANSRVKARLRELMTELEPQLFGGDNA